MTASGNDLAGSANEVARSGSDLAVPGNELANSGKEVAKRATDTRDAAAKALKEWTAEFRKVAKHTLRARPDLLAALEL